MSASWPLFPACQTSGAANTEDASSLSSPFCPAPTHGVPASSLVGRLTTRPQRPPTGDSSLGCQESYESALEQPSAPVAVPGNPRRASSFDGKKSRVRRVGACATQADGRALLAAKKWEKVKSELDRLIWFHRRSHPGGSPAQGDSRGAHNKAPTRFRRPPRARPEEVPLMWKTTPPGTFGPPRTPPARPFRRRLRPNACLRVRILVPSGITRSIFPLADKKPSSPPRAARGTLYPTEDRWTPTRASQLGRRL